MKRPHNLIVIYPTNLSPPQIFIFSFFYISHPCPPSSFAFSSMTFSTTLHTREVNPANGSPVSRLFLRVDLSRSSGSEVDSLS